MIEEVDEFGAAAVSTAAPGSTLHDLQPLTNAAFEDAVERRVVDRVAAKLAKLEEPGEFQRRVEQRAGELAAARAEQLAEQWTRERVAAAREGSS